MAEAIIKKRLVKRGEALEKARLFIDCVKNRLDSRITAILFGSYARGDFSEESDIDVLVVTDAILPLEPHYRIDKILDCIKDYPEVEPVLLTISELEERYKKRNPLIVEAIGHGIYLLDELCLGEKISSRARRLSRGY